ncbi:MAG: 3'-5' exonuclease [Bacteroidales bacterium]|nr:3'-5' exonuclease [Bacteroidales bacterium]
MELNLSKPLAIIDLETTGINVAIDRIVEISIVKVNTDNATEIYTRRVKPGIPISDEAQKVHGITEEDLKNEPPFGQIASEVANFIGNADLGGYNAIKFDIPLLMEEFLRADSDFSLRGRKIIDVQNIFHKMEPRNLAAAYRFYCKNEIVNAHSAEADAVATFEILKAQLDYYQNTPYEDANGKTIYPVRNDIQALSEFSYHARNADLAGHLVYNDLGEEVFNFGKYKGKLAEEVFRSEPQYYDWMMKSQFPLYTKKIITAIYLRRFNNESVSMKD